jgi:hypothetical protein
VDGQQRLITLTILLAVLRSLVVDCSCSNGLLLKRWPTCAFKEQIFNRSVAVSTAGSEGRMATADDQKAGTLVWEVVRMHDARAHFGLNLCEKCHDMYEEIWETSRGMRCDRCAGELVTEVLPGLKGRPVAETYPVIQADAMVPLLEYADIIQLRRKPDGEETLEIIHFTDEMRSRLSRYDD